MKKEKFFELLGEIEDKNLIIAPKKKNLPKIISAAAACVVLLVGIIITYTFAPEQNEQGENFENITSTNGVVNFVQSIEWKYATDIARENEDIYNGVFEPAFVVYDNTFYCFTETKENEKYTENISPLYFSKDYPFTVYSTQSDENIAIFINRHMLTFRPAFNIDTSSSSGEYKLLYTASTEQKNAALKNSAIFENETVKIYPLDETLYLADISQPLKKEFPDLFSGEDNYAHFYYLAVYEEYINESDGEGTFIEAITAEDLNEKTKDIFCGAYLDEGTYTVLLKNCTEEEIELVCRELSINKDTTVFKKGTYTLDYLNSVYEKISEGMMNKEFNFISSAGVYESENIISVSLLYEDKEGIKRLLALDTLGGAIRIEKGTSTIEPLIATLE